MNKQRTTSPLFMLVASAAVVAALYFAKAILLPLGLAILLSFLLTPLANQLERWRIARVPATLLVVGLLFCVLGVLGWIVTRQVIDLSHQLPNYRTNVLAKVRSVMPSSETMQKFYGALDDFGKELSDAEQGKSPATNGEPAAVSEEEEATAPIPSPAAPSRPAEPSSSAVPIPEESSVTVKATETPGDDKTVEVKVVEMPPSPLAQVRDWLGPLVAPLGTAGMVIVLVFFLLLNRENQRNRLLQLFGTSNLHATTEAMHDAGQRVGRYLRMQFLVNAGYGVAVGLGLGLIGVPGAIMWGVLGFSLRFLPYIGPWIAAGLPILVSLGAFDGWTQSLLVVGWYIGLELILNNAVEPWVYGTTTGVSVVGVILSAIFWTWLWGPVGLILAMPITVCLVVAARYIPQLRFLTVLLADQPPMTPAERIYQRLLAFDYHEPVRMAQKHLKEKPLTSFYDEALIPALVLAEHDRHAALLSDDQEAFIAESAEDLVEELHAHSIAAEESEQEVADPESAAGAALPTGSTVDVTGVRVLCVPLRDQADETVSRMLAQLLTAEGFRVDAGGADSLTGEIVERVAKLDIDVVVISVLPPIAPRDSRLLWKRLRDRYPRLPIVVGFWSGSATHEAIAPPADDDTSKVVTTLADAVALVRSIAIQQQLMAKTG